MARRMSLVIGRRRGRDRPRDRWIPFSTRRSGVFVVGSGKPFSIWRERIAAIYTSNETGDKVCANQETNSIRLNLEAESGDEWDYKIGNRSENSQNFSCPAAYVRQVLTARLSARKPKHCETSSAGTAPGAIVEVPMWGGGLTSAPYGGIPGNEDVIKHQLRCCGGRENALRKKRNDVGTQRASATSPSA